MPTVTTYKRLILYLLNQLGETPEKVAQSLKDKGFKGKRKQAHCYPIYQYLTSHGLDLGVSPSEIALYDTTTKGCDITAPLPIKQFIYDFDIGKYPELESEPSKP
jgi:hypothetical protein